MADGRKTGSILNRIGKMLTEQLVQEVPDDIALCEFDCRKTQCRYDEWENCGRRLKFDRLRRAYEAEQEAAEQAPNGFPRAALVAIGRRRPIVLRGDPVRFLGACMTERAFRFSGPFFLSMLLKHFLVGAAAALAFGGALLWSDTAGIATLIAASSDGALAMFLLFAGLISTFGPAAILTGAAMDKLWENRN